jgi:hypothetical protein
MAIRSSTLVLKPLFLRNPLTCTPLFSPKLRHYPYLLSLQPNSFTRFFAYWFFYEEDDAQILIKIMPASSRSWELRSWIDMFTQVPVPTDSWLAKTLLGHFVLICRLERKLASSYRYRGTPAICTVQPSLATAVFFGSNGTFFLRLPP